MPKPGEVLFQPDDTEGALALQAYEDDRCPGCNQPLHESTHPDMEGKYRTRLIACHSCAEKGKAQQDLHETPDTSHGVFVVTERI